RNALDVVGSVYCLRDEGSEDQICLTKHSRGTVNAWHFWFGLAFEVKAG
ncbi:DUF3265 domain-containing protein, partial [Vibrio cincinnatiensis]|nr:DUF3265 domain-containing protein [Vibrio cincinnatiensis]